MKSYDCNYEQKITQMMLILKVVSNNLNLMFKKHVLGSDAHNWQSIHFLMWPEKIINELKNIHVILEWLQSSKIIHWKYSADVFVDHFKILWICSSRYVINNQHDGFKKEQRKFLKHIFDAYYQQLVSTKYMFRFGQRIYVSTYFVTYT